MVLAIAFCYVRRFDEFTFSPLACNFHFAGLTIYAIGVASIADFQHDPDIIFGIFVVVSYLLFVIGVLMTQIMLTFSPRTELGALASRSVDTVPRSTQISLLIVVVLAVGVGVYFASSIGGSVFLNSFQARIAGASAAEASLLISVARKAIHYGADGNYYAPGYFGQFTNTLLPVALLVLYKVNIQDRLNIKSSLVLVFVLFVCAYFTTLTGRRGTLANILILSLVLFCWRGCVNYRLKKSYLALAIAVIVFILALISSFQGREGQRLFDGVMSLINRIFISPSHLELKTYNLVVYGQDIFFLNGWLSQLNDILPGHTAGLVQTIHAKLGGSSFGASGFGPFLEKMNNFGFVIGCFVSFLWGVILAIFQIFQVRTKKKDVSWLVMLYMGYLLGTSAAPIDLFNQGFVACGILIFCIKILRCIWPRRI